MCVVAVVVMGVHCVCCCSGSDGSSLCVLLQW